VHGVKARLPADAFETWRSRRHTHLPAVESWTLAEIHEAAAEVADAGFKLFAAVHNAVGGEMMWIDNVLTLEDAIRQLDTE
jgi:hypothetical protein